MAFANAAGRCAAAGLVIAAATALCRLSQANAVTAGFVYLLAVLGLAVWQGFVAGAIGSLLATLCFNFYFFPPIGTFRIEDPQNWVSLGCFLVAATVASRLVVRERERAVEAGSRRREIEALYNLCVDLFTASATPAGLDAATSRALRTIGAASGGLVLPPEGETAVDAGSWVGTAKDLSVHRLLSSAPWASGEQDPSSRARGWRDVCVPVAAGGRTAAMLVARGTRADQGTLESVARLIALAFERERLLAERARLEALQAGDSLKTSLLRAVSHDLTTPLTAILVSLETLKRKVADCPESSLTVDSVVEEATRLNRRIQNLLAMAHLEAGSLVPRRELTPAADLFRAARENLRPIASSRRIEARVAPDCPDLDVDPTLVLEILVNLIENADRASPPLAPIELVAGPHPSDPAQVRLEVLDRGAGPSPATARLGEPAFPRDSSAPGVAARKGLGLEIARSFAAAHQGEVGLLPREGGGACARIDLPAAHLADSTARELS